MNVTAIGLQAAKWVRPPASAGAAIPTPSQQSQAAPPQGGRNVTNAPALMSSATQHALLMATQADGSAPAEEHIPPAQQARAAILENPALEDRPFGSIVSHFARGEAPEVEAPAEAPSDTPSVVITEGGDGDEIVISPPPVNPDALIDETLLELL